MIRATLVATFVSLALAVPAVGQGVVSDVLMGNLIKPRVGQWAWYDLTDSASDQRYVVRLAIVDKERMDKQTGHWLEVEVIPAVGYPAVYKMLLTGPASNPRNVHRIIHKSGAEPATEVALDPDQAPEPESQPDRRLDLGKESVETLEGPISARKFALGPEDAPETAYVWTNDKVRPMGIARMVSPEGELRLRNYGEGGEFAASRLGAGGSLLEREGPSPRIGVDIHNGDRTQQEGE